MFSEIAEQFHAPLNSLYRERDVFLTKGRRITDMVSGNADKAGIQFPLSVLERALQEGLRRAKSYRPDPLGQRPAREAIARFYRGEGLLIPTDQILLTPGTSISYWYAFKLLANPGDEVLCPRPSYPLFDAIAALSGIRLVPYTLKETSQWRIDLDHLAAQVNERTRTIVLISPHNPTGAVADEREIAGLVSIARRHHLSIISDEVFSPFVWTKRQEFPRPARPSEDPLVLTLNGFSKMFALPGMKLWWIVVTGETSRVRKAMQALEIFSDTFLPVNEAVQFAVPDIFRHGREFSLSYQAKVKACVLLATKLLAGASGINLVPPQGGFHITVRLPDRSVNEETAALTLLKRERILVHPGYFYDMDENHLIFSFLQSSSTLRRNIEKMLPYFSEHPKTR